MAEESKPLVRLPKITPEHQEAWRDAVTMLEWTEGVGYGWTQEAVDFACEVAAPAVQAEIERLRSDLARVVIANAEVAKLNAEQAETIERLRAALERYGSHTSSCRTRDWTAGGHSWDDATCDCGLREAARGTVETFELRTVPTAWVRGVKDADTANGPGEWNADFVYGDDRPDGDGWIPLYSKPPHIRPAEETAALLTSEGTCTCPPHLDPLGCAAKTCPRAIAARAAVNGEPAR